MKRLLLSFLFIVFIAGLIHAQTGKKTASQPPFACSAAIDGLVYLDFKNQDARKSFRCNGKTWLEVPFESVTNSPKNRVKDSELEKNGFQEPSKGLVIPNNPKSNTKNSSSRSNTLVIKDGYTAANSFANKSLQEISTPAFQPDKPNLPVLEIVSYPMQMAGQRDKPLFFNSFSGVGMESGLSSLPVFNFFPLAQTQERKRFELSGAASIGFNSSRVNTQPMDPLGIFSNPIISKSHELSYGLDLHFGTYIIDPRFINFSADASFARDKGAFDDYETRNGLRGLGFAVDFLQTSPYPFRFRYVKQNTNFLDRFGETTDSERSILGFNWQLRKAKLPSLVVNYDRISYNSKFAAASFFKTKGQTFSITAADTFRGWNVNSGYIYQTTDEELTGLETRQNFLQFQARKEFSKKTDLFIGSFFEKLRFSSGLTGTEQKISLFDVHSDLNYRPTDKLSTRLSQRFYYNDNESRNLPSNGGGNQFAALDTMTYFNSFGGQLTYRFFPELNLGATANMNFIKSPGDQFESATQIHDLAVNASWNKSIKSFYFYANVLEGIAFARSNFGKRRNMEFRSYNAGGTFGNVRRMLFSADYNYSYRPDIFQIGGYFSEHNFSVTATTEAIKPFRLHSSVGENLTVYLTSRGREDFDRVFYSAGIEHRRFTFQFARNLNDGLRDIFANNFPIPTNRIFIVLPKDFLIRDPFLRTRGESTSAMFRIQPLRDLTFEARYIDDRVNFVLTNDVAVRQFDVIGYYKLGKFIFSGGYSRQKQTTENAFSRERDYYFFRATRTFKIF